MSEENGNGEIETPEKPPFNYMLVGVGILVIGALMYFMDKFIILAPKFKEPEPVKEEESAGGW